MLKHDPVPWLMAQEGLPAVRARQVLRIRREGDEKTVRAVARKLARAQSPDGSFEHSPMKTAGVLNLLDDLRAEGARHSVVKGAEYLFSVLESHPGYERARRTKPGALRTDWDLCGFFGPYEARSDPDVMAHGAREMNFYREYEPLLGPKSPVRAKPKSTLDRAGPSSCYSWGLIPLAYTVEALCRAGYARDERLRPAVNALLGAQRGGGGWCRGGPNGAAPCTVHALRALGCHPELRTSPCAQRALEFMQSTRRAVKGCNTQVWKGAAVFATIQALAAFDLPTARQLTREALESVRARQQKDGTFGQPCRAERVLAVLVALNALRRTGDVQ